MLKKIKSAIFCVSALVFAMGSLHAVASESDAGYIYTNSQTGYRAIVEDDAMLISDEEEQTLLGEMEEITAYGNAIFKTIDVNNYYSTENYAANYLESAFGYGESATIFLIDMDNRMLYVYSTGTIYNIVTGSYADSITDNVYTYATDGEYYTCASMAFAQILTLLQGQNISQPMKYISNALLGIILALLLNYFLVRLFSATRKPSGKEVLSAIFTKQEISGFHADYERETRRYCPSSSGGGGGGHGGGGGGHGGGGGGGGHSF